MTDTRSRLWAEVAVFAAVAFILWIVAHGLWHGLLDPSWTGREVLTVTLVLGWLGFRYYKRRRARLRRQLTAR